MGLSFKKLCPAVFVVVSVFLFNPGPVFTAPVKVCTTLYPIADWVSEICGEEVQTLSLVDGRSGIDTFMPMFSDISAVRECDVFILFGIADESWARPLMGVLNNARVIVLADGADLIDCSVIRKGDEFSGNDELFMRGQPAVWMDPLSASIMIDELAKILSSLMPSRKEFFLRNKENYIQKITMADARLRSAALKMPLKRMVCLDGGLAYIARRYGLEYVSASLASPGLSFSRSGVSAFLQFLRGMDAGSVIYYTQPLSLFRSRSLLRDYSFAALRHIDIIGGRSIDGGSRGYLDLLFDLAGELEKSCDRDD